MYEHWQQIENWPLQHFDPGEFACKCCGRIVVTEAAMSSWLSLDQLRGKINRPIRVNSATRCPRHNKTVGGAITSQHLAGRAYDVVPAQVGFMKSYNLQEFFMECVYYSRECGFTAIGVYAAFIHLDTRLRRTGTPVIWFQ